MKIALCNEVVRELPFSRQCAVAKALGYDGLELAPFTFGEEAYRMPSTQRAEIRRTMADAGLVCSGLHWLLAAPAGLSITTADKAVHERTIDVMQHLVELCAELGGGYLVHGSPGQRRISIEPDAAAAKARAVAAWSAAAVAAHKAGVVYLIEPLARPDAAGLGADFVNTVGEAVAIIEQVRTPSLKTMIDACAASSTEAVPLADVVRRWLPSGHVAHIHLNDRNRRGPGEGADRFTDMLRALHETSYTGWLGIEPFVYEPDGVASAARSIGYVRGVLEAVA